MRDRLAVLGSPIAHSQSPALHRAAYSVLDRPWTYERIETHEHELPVFLSERDASWRGLSLTMPLKSAAFAASETLDDDARLTGAVNTLRLNSGPTAGFNTDVAGIVRAVHAAGTLTAESVLILGGGATAASAVAAAARLGASHVDVAVRAPERAAQLSQLAAVLDIELVLRRFATDPVDSGADVIISTLPGGIDAPERYLPSARRHALLLDVAYAPWPSPLALAWHEENGRVINGLSLLVHQALLQVRIFDSGSPLEALAHEDRVLGAMRDAVNLSSDGLI